jgi:hypothetical protein
VKRAKEIAATMLLVALVIALCLLIGAGYDRISDQHEPAEPSTCFTEERGTVCP